MAIGIEYNLHVLNDRCERCSQHPNAHDKIPYTLYMRLPIGQYTWHPCVCVYTKLNLHDPDRSFNWIMTIPKKSEIFSFQLFSFSFWHINRRRCSLKKAMQSVAFDSLSIFDNDFYHYIVRILSLKANRIEFFVRFAYHFLVNVTTIIDKCSAFSESVQVSGLWEKYFNIRHFSFFFQFIFSLAWNAFLLLFLIRYFIVCKFRLWTWQAKWKSL